MKGRGREGGERGKGEGGQSTGEGKKERKVTRELITMNSQQPKPVVAKRNLFIPKCTRMHVQYYVIPPYTRTFRRTLGILINVIN